MCAWAALPTRVSSGSRARCRAHAHIIGIMCESEGPRARRRAQAASTPRRTAPLTLSAHTRPRVRPHIRHVGHPSPTMKQPPSMLIFPHQQAEKSPQNQHVLSFNPQVSQQHKLEGAGPEADPFEYPINTVQVFRCAPFLGSPFVGVALGLMTINVRTPPVGTIERSWQFPENFSASGSSSRLRAQDR